jgi:hypothetical protein
MSERTASTIRGRDTAPPKSDAEVRGQIDAFYDQAETYVTGLGRIMGVDTSGAPRDGERDHVTTVRGSAIASAKPVLQLPSPMRKFEIVPAFAVTNGRESVTVATREAAEELLAKLREAGQ